MNLDMDIKDIKDVKKCIVCGSEDIKYLKRHIKCNNCNSKIGVTNNKLWYEYTLNKNEE
jgi:DNA-directed RNA polymerase subunit RPC12/RpoP